MVFKLMAPSNLQLKMHLRIIYCQTDLNRLMLFIFFILFKNVKSPLTYQLLSFINSFPNEFHGNSLAIGSQFNG